MARPSYDIGRNYATGNGTISNGFVTPEMRTLSGHTDRVMAVAFSPDGRFLASGSADKSVGVWSLETGQLAHVIAAHEGFVLSVAFSIDSPTACDLFAR